MIRKVGYRGTSYTLNVYKSDPELRELGHTAAHLIHGPSEGRFRITYAPGKLTRDEITKVGFDYLDLETAIKKYSRQKLKHGLNIINGDEIYFIPYQVLGCGLSKRNLLIL